MLRQAETLRDVTEYNGYTKMLRERRADDPLVVEYHGDEYFVRAVYECGEWLVKWFDTGARPLCEVGRFDNEDAAMNAAEEQFRDLVSNGPSGLFYD